MSSSLVRSAYGLANQHLFYGVDLVVYCEGGKGHPSLDAAITGGSEETPDAAFWRTVFKAVHPDLRVYIKSVGSKQTALAIANKAAGGTVRTVAVCTDTDFDNVPPKIKCLSNQVRTRGYSWESDLANIDVLRCVFFSVRSPSRKSESACAELEDWHSSFVTCCAPYVLEDVRRIKSGRDGVFDRSNPVRNINNNIKSKPDLNINYLNRRVDDPIADTKELQEITEEISIEQCCYGKMIVKACYHAFLHFSKKVRKGRLDFDDFIDLAIRCFEEILLQRGEVYKYYRSALRQFGEKV